VRTERRLLLLLLLLRSLPAPQSYSGGAGENWREGCY